MGAGVAKQCPRNGVSPDRQSGSPIVAPKAEEVERTLR
jgi:hypothetical protein